MEDTGLMKPAQWIPIVLGAALLMALVSATLFYSQKEARLYYRRVLFSEKIEDVLGVGMSAKKEIIAAQQEFKEETEYWENNEILKNTALTAGKTMKGGSVHYPQGSATTINSVTNINEARPSRTHITESWDGRLDYIESLVEGQPRLACARNETILLAVVGDAFMWEKKIKVFEDGTIFTETDENVTLWIRLSDNAAEELYRSLEMNSSRSFMYPKILASWLLGDIKAYPVGKVKDIASCLTSP